MGSAIKPVDQFDDVPDIGQMLLPAPLNLITKTDDAKFRRIGLNSGIHPNRGGAMKQICKYTLIASLGAALLAGCQTSWGTRYTYLDETYVLTYYDGTGKEQKGYEVGVFMDGKYTAIERTTNNPGPTWRNVELLGVEQKPLVIDTDRGGRD